MKNMSRRAFFSNTAALAGVALLAAGCTTAKDGKTTTITIDVAKIQAYGQAGLNAAATIESALTLFPTLSAYVLPIQVATAALQAVLNDFSTQAGGQVTISYNATNWKTIVDSILADIQKLASLIEAVALAAAKSALGVPADTVNQVNLVYNALTTIVSVFRALLVTTTAENAVHPAFLPMAPSKLAMTESQALHVLRAA